MIWNYLLKRVLLMIPTLLGIMLLNFAVVQAVPGGPVDQMISQIKKGGFGHGNGVLERVTSGGADMPVQGGQDANRGAQGLDPELLAQIRKLYGFDKPAPERFLQMLKQYAMFDFGESFFRSARVSELIVQRLPVSISLGLWSTLLIYLIAVPLGIAKAVRDGSRFDVATSVMLTVCYAVPSFLFAVALVVLFAGGSYLDWFPLRGLVSENWHDLAWPARILDYFWHIALPVLAMVMGGFASLAMLTKNSFLDEVHKQYVLTARAKGLSEGRVLWGHVFRNAMLLVISGLPAAFLGALFTGALLIEVIFSLDGLGLLGFEAAMQRDYPVMFGTLYIFTFLGLIVGLIGDLTYRWVDPRIDFERRG